MSKCNGCKYAIMDYCEYCGNEKQYFVDGCEKGLIWEEEPVECGEFEEVNEV